MTRKYDSFEDLISGLDSEGITDEDDEMVGSLDEDDLQSLFNHPHHRPAPRPAPKAKAKTKRKTPR